MASFSSARVVVLAAGVSMSHALTTATVSARQVARAHVVAIDDRSWRSDDREWQTVTVAPGRKTLDQSGGEFTLDDLKAQATALNPVIGYYDPLGLGDLSIFEENVEASLGFVRQAEIKHGRVAMAGFVGYMVHENGLRWPFPLTLADAAKPAAEWYADYDGLSAPEVWDKIPFNSKLQIIFFIGFLEIWGEQVGQIPGEAEKGNAHYMRGGKPGTYPSFKPLGLPLDLWIPIPELNPKAKGMSPELKQRRLLMEVNNGRLAMLGLFGFLSAAKVPGSVPIIGTWFPDVKPYAGEVMLPFGADLAGEISAWGFN